MAPAIADSYKKRRVSMRQIGRVRIQGIAIRVAFAEFSDSGFDGHYKKEFFPTIKRARARVSPHCKKTLIMCKFGTIKRDCVEFSYTIKGGDVSAP